MPPAASKSPKAPKKQVLGGDDLEDEFVIDDAFMPPSSDEESEMEDEEDVNMDALGRNLKGKAPLSDEDDFETFSDDEVSKKGSGIIPTAGKKRKVEDRDDGSGDEQANKKRKEEEKKQKRKMKEQERKQKVICFTVDTDGSFM